MKILLRKIEDTITMVVSEFLLFIKWIIHYKHSSAKEKNSNLGEKVVLICNGPSAKDFPYEIYKKAGYSFCCVNSFAIENETFFT